MSQRSGAALLIALAFIVILSTVVLALFSSTRKDLQSASVYVSGQETLRLAQTAVNVVQGQIRDATIQPRVGWASQPGMVRAFDTSGNVTAYKLYSSDVMVKSGFGQSDITAEVNAMNNWNNGAAGKSYNALYCDLNSPAVVKRPDPADPDNTINTPVFPIADPAVLDTDPSAAVSTGAVEGFTANATVSGTTIATNDTRRLPMPVKWLYILKDGQLAASTGNSTIVTLTAASSSAQPPSQTNPVVGRIAFWTDDDTCKLNINTASEGTFWDTPKASTKSEKRLAIALPVQGEFQRIPAHPATTSLSSALGGLIPRSPEIFFRTDYANMVGSNDTTYYDAIKPYYDLSPRINTVSVGGGDKTSRAGLARTGFVYGLNSSGNLRSDAVDATIWPISDRGESPSGRPVAHDTDRLYASPDEILFNPARTSNHPSFTSNAISRRDFFMTAQSKAPETTLYGTPKISMWPQQTDASNHRNIKDRLIAFCSSIAGQPYYFQRTAGGPGLKTGIPNSDKMEADASISRNGVLLDYFRKLCALQVPGEGTDTFMSKWGGTSGVDAILAQIFDLIRSNLNEFQVDGMDKNYQYASYLQTPTAKYDAGPRRSVVPAKVGTSQGMGRFLFNSGFAIVFMASEVDSTTLQTTKMRAFLLMQSYNPTPGFPEIAPGVVHEISELQSHSITVNTRPLNPDSLGFPSSATSRSGSNVNPQGSASGGDVFPGVRAPFVGSKAAISGSTNYVSGTTNKTAGTADADLNYPFIGSEIDVSGASTFTYSGGPVTVRIKSYKSNETVQTINLNFPAVTTNMPIPQNVGTGAGQDTISTTITADTTYLSFNQRVNASNVASPYFIATIIRPGDVVLGLHLDPNGPSLGDLRLLSLTGNVPSNWFVKHPHYGTVSTPFINPSTAANVAAAINGRFAHSFRSEGASSTQYLGSGTGDSETRWLNNYGWMQATPTSTSLARTLTTWSTRTQNDNANDVGTLVPGLSYGPNASPIVPHGTRGAKLPNGRIGDWTSGFGHTRDGAFFLRPDPGNADSNLYGYFGHSQDTSNYSYEPSRYAPSPVIFGSLLTPNSGGSLVPWQTLLFSPYPAAGNDSSDHYGFTSPADHYLLDWLWMPVVEPYALSEPLSTSGKININFQMMPFSHIERSTALRGALRPLMLAEVRDSLTNTSETYKWAAPQKGINDHVRSELDHNETIKAFTARFTAGNIYKTASEVCTVPLIPTGSKVTDVENWWTDRRATSDSMRESPYVSLYPRVTTKSNTFTVHYRVQAVRQGLRPGRNWAQWDETLDQVAGEYRGSTTIERYLDPNTPNIPDYTAVNLSGNYDPIDKFYRWRIVSEKQFAP